MTAKRMLKRLDEICQLKSGWNGEESVPVSISIAAKAMEWYLKWMAINPSDHIVAYPTAIGGIQFEWERSGHGLEIEFYPDRLPIFRDFNWTEGQFDEYRDVTNDPD